MDEPHSDPRRKIRQKALELGFDECGFSAVRELTEERNHLQEWLGQGMNGNMAYMANHFEKRLNPGQLEEGAKTVISVLINYYPKSTQSDPDAPVISKYAYGRDYHFIVREKLNLLLAYIQQEISPCSGRGFVDSAPVLERTLARAAGLGWIGKHSLLINKYLGSYVFIGELIIDLEFQPDLPLSADHCGTCTRCIDACPTKAIVQPYVVDARRCISYHTIENREEAPEEIRRNFQQRIFGCDICQDVCPWNRVITPRRDDDFSPVEGILELSRKEWEDLTPEAYREMFRKTAFERAGYQRLKRNIGYLEKKE